MKTDLKTPEWIDSIIDNLAPDRVAEEIRGDLYELFLKDIDERGMLSARRRYVRNGLGFLAKSFFWRKSDSNNSLIMLGIYFKMARRSLSAYKGTSIINILGLVIGIAAALVILTVIRFELSFDTFHSKADRTYRMVRISGDDMSEFRTGISFPVPVAIKEEIPSLENIVSMEYMGGVNVDVVDQSGTTLRKFREETGCALVEQDFFNVFDFKDTDFKWIAGNPDNALKEPFTVVLTKTMAKKYFGDEQVLGQTLRFQKKIDCKVTGIIEDFPHNTDFPFTIMISYETIRSLAGEDGLNDWFGVNDSHHTYLVLTSGTTKAEMEASIAKVHAAHTPKELHEFRHYLLQEFRNVHYDARFGNFSGRTISKQTILGLAIVTIFLLMTGSINYINLSTAQSALRAKEIGLRKVMGSNRKHLVLQFFTETFLLVLTAGIVALALSEILLFNLQSLLNLKLTEYNFTDPFILLSLMIIIITVTLFSGFYPSLMISRFNPISALQNRFSTQSFGGISLRKVLVVVQFTITQMLVVGTFIVVGQMRYFQNVDMGFNREAIITAKISDLDPVKRRTLENQLRAQAFVSDVSFSYTLPSGVRRNRSSQDIGLPDATSMEDYVIFEFAAIDPFYLRLYEIPLLAGRNLTMQDTTGNILINKTLVKNLGLGTPQDAVGRELKMGSSKATVVGVVGDFYSNSLKEGVDNVVMFIREENYSTLNVKLNVSDQSGSLADAVKAIEKIWASTYPDFIFSYQFLDDNIDAFYAQEEKYAKLFQLFSLIFLLIGCLGLYGLITFVVNRKGKEVAIRKVLGATFGNILMMFSKEYVRLIILSFLLAVPVAYYVVNEWLSNFENHIVLQWWFFVTPGLMVLIIALFVVITKSLAAANANPVDRLKYE
jgi:ABC-type antimicrobial peptide transport system permease subunit